MTDLACADCGHNVVLHDGQGCTVSSCDCTTPPPVSRGVTVDVARACDHSAA